MLYTVKFCLSLVNYFGSAKARGAERHMPKDVSLTIFLRNGVL